MKISTRDQVSEKYGRLTEWHACFAWLPVTLTNGDTVWLESVERRLEGGEQRWDYDGLIRIWEYRKSTTPG